MRKHNRIAMFSCITICCVVILVIFDQHHAWSEETFNEMMFENQGAYAKSQREEVIANVEDVRTAIRTMAAVLETCESEEEMKNIQPDMSTGEKGGDTEETWVMSYMSFSEEDLTETENAGEEFLEELREGQPAVSDIYRNEQADEVYYEVAEPVSLNGQNVGYVRALVKPGILLTTSQIGFLRDETEAYLIHGNGDNALLAELSEKARKKTNLYNMLKNLCDEPERIETLEKDMAEGKELSIIQSTAGEKPIFISVCRLPYNDWMIVNITQSEQIDKYMNETAAQGRKSIFAAIAVTIVMGAVMILIYCVNDKKRHFERRRSELLANFSDTVLCEYEFKKDRLVCTSNIVKMLFIQEPTVERFRAYAKERGLIHPGDMNIVKDILKYIPEEGEIRDYQMRLKNREGVYNWYAVSVTALGTSQRAQKHLILKLTDITESKKEIQGLLQKSQRDALTGLLNREVFGQKVKEALKKEKGGYLFLIDIDEFKHVNDRFGHRSGDEILKKTADSMRRCFRSGDYVGRFGGDEFLAFVPGQTGEKVIKDRAESLVDAVERIRSDAHETLRVTCSVGVARCCEGESYEELLERADRAMYHVKEQGRDSWILE